MIAPDRLLEAVTRYDSKLSQATGAFQESGDPVQLVRGYGDALESTASEYGIGVNLLDAAWKAWGSIGDQAAC